MGIFDLFSKKKRDAERESPEVFRYDEIPDQLRIQLLHALDDARKRIYARTVPAYIAVGTEGSDIFAKACLVLRRELGLGKLVEVRRRVRSMNDTQTKDQCEEFTVFFENCEPEQVLDAVQVVMGFIEEAGRNGCLDHECTDYSQQAGGARTRERQASSVPAFGTFWRSSYGSSCRVVGGIFCCK